MRFGGFGRRAAFGAVLIVSVAFAAGGMVGSRWIQSPQEAAASRQPPTPSVLTAGIEYRVLVDNLVTRGDVVVGRSVDVPLVASGDSRPVVTGVRVRKGQSVRSGQAVVEVSGRPVIVLAGRAPAYRDLRPGAEGKDVLEAQHALARLGYSVGGDPPGILGPGTQEALRRLYEAIGYDVPIAGTDADLDSARSGVIQAERSYASARRSLDRMRRAPSGGGHTHQYEVQDAKLAVRYAAEDRAEAHRMLAQTVAVSGPMLPLSEALFVPGLPATVAKLAVTVGSPAQGTGLALATGIPRITARIDPLRRALIREGMHVRVLMSGSEKEIDATITGISSETDDGQGGVGNVVTIAPRVRLPGSAVGEDVRITVTTASTDHKVLVAPLAAVTSSADGTTNVAVLEASGEQRRVRVSVGVSAEGYVELAPAYGDVLTEGDRVVVGTR